MSRTAWSASRAARSTRRPRPSSLHAAHRRAGGPDALQGAAPLQPLRGEELAQVDLRRPLVHGAPPRPARVRQLGPARRHRRGPDPARSRHAVDRRPAQRRTRSTTGRSRPTTARTPSITPAPSASSRSSACRCGPRRRATPPRGPGRQPLLGELPLRVTDAEPAKGEPVGASRYAAGLAGGQHSMKTWGGRFRERTRSDGRRLQALDRGRP